MSKSISRQKQLLCSAFGLLLLAPWQAGRAQPPAPAWDTYSDTWVGSDALGRKLPTYEATGPPRPNKTLGMFYFQTFDSLGDGPYGH